jgi:hypothetical protein
MDAAWFTVTKKRPRDVPRKKEHMQEEFGKLTSQGAGEAVQRVLHDVQFPASKQDLIRAAQQNNIPAPIVDKIRSLPGEQFNSPQDVANAVGQQM